MFAVYGAKRKLCLQAVVDISVCICVAVLLVHSPAALNYPLLCVVQRDEADVHITFLQI